MMQTKHLMQFAAVASAGNISEAAKRLNIAQPALSQSILTFEESLGIKLFNRHRRGVELTEAGEELLTWAISILDQIETAKETIRQIDESPSGKVTAAFPASVAHAIVEPLCRQVLEKHPRIFLHIEEGLTGNIGRWLFSGRVDIMIDFDVGLSGDLRSEPLISEDLYLIGANLGSNEDIPFADLVDYPLLLPGPEHAMSKAIARFEREQGILLTRVAMEMAVHPMLRNVIAGNCYSISPWSLIHDRVASGTLFARRVVNPTLSREASIVTHRSRPETPAVKLIREAIRKTVIQSHTEDVWRGRLLLEDIDG
nr:LysR family transcriptional regulator [Hyphomonas sp. Mor2]